MPVYVDQPLRHTQGKFRNGCHMIADTLEELHTFAALLKLKEEWFQPTSWPHYDLTENKRNEAIMLGAKEVKNSEAIGILRANYPRPMRQPNE